MNTIPETKNMDFFFAAYFSAKHLRKVKCRWM